MRRVTENETAAAAEALGGAVMDAIGREPAARLEHEIGPGLAQQRWNHLREVDLFVTGERSGQDADDAPAVLAAHREEQVETVAPEKDVGLGGLHRAGRLGVGDEEDVLIGRAWKRDAVEIAHRAARTVAACHPRCRHTARASVGLAKCARDLALVLLECNQLRVPRDIDSIFAESFAHDALVVVLAEKQDERIRAKVRADVAHRDACGPAAVGPHVGAGCPHAERQRLLDDAEPGVDFERACLNADSPRLLCGPRVAIDHQWMDAAPGELVGQHQARRTGADNENIHIHGEPPRLEFSAPPIRDLHARP